MSLIQPILGFGQIHGTDILAGATRTFPDEADIITPFGVVLKFYSETDELVGVVATDYDNAPTLLTRFKEKRIGGLNEFEFQTSRNPEVPFSNQMVVRYFIGGVHWYTGELLYRPEEDTRDVLYEYEGRGYVHYLKEIKTTQLYQNKTLKFILDDLIENILATNTPVRFNPEKINPPDITVVKLEINNKSLEKAMKMILEIANVNYKTTQYRYNVDKEIDFTFEAISNDIQDGFFEGFQYQNPKTSIDTKGIINTIKIFRAQEGSQTVEEVSTISDSNSIAKYGVKRRDITIADFVDTATAEKIANAIIERFKDPLKMVAIKNLNIEESPFPIGFYYINNKLDNYVKLITDNEDLSDWDLFISNTSVTETGDTVLSGKKCLKIITASGSITEYIEFELEEEMMYPDTLRLFINQSVLGEAIRVTAFDVDGNFIELALTIRIMENGIERIQENEVNRRLEAGGIGIDVRLVSEWQDYNLDISALDNLKKVRISMTTDDAVTIYFDRVELQTRSWFQNNLVLEEIEYIMDESKIIADAKYGEKIETLLDSIKKLDEQQQNTIGIFEKT